MSINIIKKHIKYNFTNQKIDTKYIVIHDTGNESKGATAEMHYRYFNSGDRSASAHYFVDDKQIIETIDPTLRAWHTGRTKNGFSNGNCIGIEMCVNSDGNLELTYQNTLKLIIYLMKRFNIPYSNVIRHYDVSSYGKICPRHMSDNNWQAWTIFKSRLNILLNPVIKNAKPIKPIEPIKSVKQSEPKPEPKPISWKTHAVQNLIDKGILTDEDWLEAIDEPVQLWTLAIIVQRILDKIDKINK